jgi:hypothetical protein
MRHAVANTYRCLEWGELTSSPRSRVFDASGRGVFTGSEVAVSEDPEIVGVVEELLSPSEVRVCWSGGARECLCPTRLRVRVAIPEARLAVMRADLAEVRVLARRRS